MSTIKVKSIFQIILFCFIALNVCRVKSIKTNLTSDFEKIIQSELSVTENDNNSSGDDYYDDYEPTDNVYNTVDESKGNSLLSKLLDIHNKNSDIPIVKNVNNINKTLEIIDRLSSITFNLTKDIVSKSEMSKLVEMFFNFDVPMDCLLSLVQVVTAVRKEELWAVKFLDSMGRIPTGIAEGTVSHFGEFDECLGIEGPVKDNGETIRGQYCLAKVILPYPILNSSDNSRYLKTPTKQLAHKQYYHKIVEFLRNYNMDKYLTVFKLIEILNNQRGATFRFGTCFPTTCRPQDMETLINQIVYPITHLPIELLPDCYVKNETVHFDYFQLFSLAILLIIIGVSITCNIIEIMCKLYKMFGKSKTSNKDSNRDNMMECSKFEKLVMCFSLSSNIKLLFDKTGPKRFVCIDAIRFLLIINVCVDHMYLFTPFLSTIAFRRILNSVITKVYYYNKYFFARNILIIDTMFIISGLLVSYGLYGKLHKTKGKFNYFTYLMRLWLKYAVPMFIVLLLFWLLPLIGDGPIWNYGINLIMPSCKDNYSLFSSFFFFSNYRIQDTNNIFDFGPGFAICNPPTWFLSALFQLQSIAPLVVLVLYKYPKCGITLTVTIVLFGCYASISPRLLFGQKTYLDPLGISSLEEMTKAFVAFHMGINQYIISFFIGILIGYFVRENINYKNLSQKMESFLWILSFSTIILVMYWYMTLHTINRSPSKFSVLLWFSVGKLMACSAISWILFSLCIGRAAFLEKIFSWYGFQVVSRLSFGIYILHFLPLSYRLFSVRDTYVMTDKLLIEYITIDFIISAFIAFLFYILIERPFNNLFTLLFERKGDDDFIDEVSNKRYILPQINVFTANCHEIYNNKI